MTHGRRRRAKRLTKRFIPSVVLSSCIAGLLSGIGGVPAVAQASTIVIEPASYLSGTTFYAPGNANDGNDLTSADATLSRVCGGSGTSPISATATWLYVPDGYHPLRLEVHWKATAITELYGGDASRIEANLEYSLDSGSSWSHAWDSSENGDYVWTGDSPACSGSGITCDDHVSTKALTDYQRTGAIQVRATLTAQMTACVHNPAENIAQLSVADIRIVVDNCQIPIAESSAAEGWNISYPTAHNFLQTLTPASSNTFYNRIVREQDAGGGTDGCYYVGSSIDPETTVSGGSWTVAIDNSWGTVEDPAPFDTVGWFPDGVTYYQAHSTSLPCYFTWHQQMQISCQTSSTFVPYIENTLEGGINTIGASAQRQTTYVERTWP